MTTTVYVVYCDSCDGFTPEGPVSYWDNFDDAEAAAGEAQAMDSENSYSVQYTIEEDLGPIWRF